MQHACSKQRQYISTSSCLTLCAERFFGNKCIRSVVWVQNKNRAEIREKKLFYYAVLFRGEPRHANIWMNDKREISTDMGWRQRGSWCMFYSWHNGLFFSFHCSSPFFFFCKVNVKPSAHVAYTWRNCVELHMTLIWMGGKYDRILIVSLLRCEIFWMQKTGRDGWYVVIDL